MGAVRRKTYHDFFSLLNFYRRGRGSVEEDIFKSLPLALSHWEIPST